MTSSNRTRAVPTLLVACAECRIPLRQHVYEAHVQNVIGLIVECALLTGDGVDDFRPQPRVIGKDCGVRQANSVNGVSRSTSIP